MSNLRLRGTVARGVLWAGLGNWMHRILSFAMYAALARLVGPESFGLVALGGVYVSFIEIFVTQGFGTALVQRKELEGGHLNAAFWISVIMGASLTLASVLLAGQVAILFGEPRLADVLRWLSCALLLFGVAAIPHAVLTRGMAFRVLAIRSLLATLTGGIVGLTMAWTGYGVWSLVGQQLSSATTGVAALWYATSWRPSFRVSRRHVHDLYGFAISILGNNLLWFGSQRADQTLIGFRFSASVLGPYALANRGIHLLIEIVSAPLAAVALPAFSRLQDEPERLRSAFYKATEVVAAVAMPAFCGMVILAPSLVGLVFGPEWSASVPLFQVLALFGLLRTTFCFGHPLMLAIGRPGTYLLLFAFHAGLTLGLCLLAALWSPLAVAAAVSVAMSVHSAVFLVVCRRLTGISIRTLASRLWAPTVSAAAMSAAVLALRQSAQHRLGDLLVVVTGVSLGASVYVVAMMILRFQLIRELYEIIAARFTGDRAPVVGKDRA
jgi:O-antigen/teichoic acid export membrane protein